MFSERYKIIKQLGQGTQGLVFLGENIETSQQYAIKRCVCKNETQANELISEYDLLSSLDHPNIIKYHAYFKNVLLDEYTEDETIEIVLVMDVCESSLTDYMAALRRDKLVFDGILLENWIKQICSSLKYLHEKEIIHRDVKPDNILIKTGGSENPVDWVMTLIDFGCASGPTRPKGPSVGTPLYMAPEITSGEYDEKVDNYSFGVLLYEMLTLKNLEDLSRDMDNIKLHHTLINKMLKGYTKFFVEICTMLINRNKVKRSQMRDVFAFIKNMGSFSIKPGPVISKSDLEALMELDIEDLLEEFQSDTQRQKDFIRDVEKKSSQINTPEPVVVITPEPVPTERRSSVMTLKAKLRKSFVGNSPVALSFVTPGNRKSLKTPTEALSESTIRKIESEQTMNPEHTQNGPKKRKSLSEMFHNLFNQKK